VAHAQLAVARHALITGCNVRCFDGDSLQTADATLIANCGLSFCYNTQPEEYKYTVRLTAGVDLQLPRNLTAQ
jgi:hypothetical protein